MPHFIRIGSGSRIKVYLDEEALAEGDLELDDGCDSEQCSHCGEDIMETGTIYSDSKGSNVLCDELAGGCGTRHPVEEEDAT